MQISYSLKNMYISNVMLEQFAIVKRYNCITAEAVLLADICIKQRIFYFTLYREVTKLVSLFITQDRDEDCLRRFCEMGNPSNKFTLWYGKKLNYFKL